MRRPSLKPSISMLKRTGFKPRTTPMASGKTGMLSVPSVQLTDREQATEKLRAHHKRLKSKERPVTPAEKALWTRMAEECGCIACRRDRRFNPHVSIHHNDGRTKPGCHRDVLPLCAGHHQDQTGNDKTLIAVHPYKARFEARYGTQAELKAEVYQILGVAV